MKIKCWTCGKVATKTIPHSYYDIKSEKYIEWMPKTKEPTTWYRCYCDECYEKLQEAEKEEMRQYVYLKKRMMFKRACNLLEKQNIDMYKYKEAIDVVEEHMKNHPDKYDSSYETIAAIVLVQNHIMTKMQYRIGKYQVDFLLPELGIVLEIDGERHKYTKCKDSRRDEEIKQALGYGWEIIRIKTDYLDMNASKLVKAIKAVDEYRETNHIPWRKLYE